MRKSDPICPAELTLRYIGGRWKSVIWWHLKKDKKRFGELRKAIPKITQNMLTQQLRELERDGIVKRKVFPEVPLRVEYSLTDFGLTLKPVVNAMVRWGIEKDPGRWRT